MEPITGVAAGLVVGATAGWIARGLLGATPGEQSRTPKSA